jgi:hypothetical protein
MAELGSGELEMVAHPQWFVAERPAAAGQIEGMDDEGDERGDRQREQERRIRATRLEMYSAGSKKPFRLTLATMLRVIKIPESTKKTRTACRPALP